MVKIVISIVDAQWQQEKEKKKEQKSNKIKKIEGGGGGGGGRGWHHCPSLIQNHSGSDHIIPGTQAPCSTSKNLNIWIPTTVPVSLHSHTDTSSLTITSGNLGTCPVPLHRHLQPNNNLKSNDNLLKSWYLPVPLHRHLQSTDKLLKSWHLSISLHRHLKSDNNLQSNDNLLESWYLPRCLWRQLSVKQV